MFASYGQDPAVTRYLTWQDEAASRLKIELDSMPTEIDMIEREIMQFEMERQALKKEKDPASKERLTKTGKRPCRFERKVRRPESRVAKGKCKFRDLSRSGTSKVPTRGRFWN